MASAVSAPTAPARASPWVYELVPQLALPEVDLSVSVKSRLVRSKVAPRLIRAFARTPLTFFGYLMFEAAGIAVFFLPAPIGRAVAIVGTLAGLPGTIVAVGNFRFELVVVLLKTFDICFFIVITTVTCTLLGILLHDARSLLLLLCWVAFTTNIFVDASILGLRAIWLGNIGALACFATIGVATTIQVTDQLYLCNVITANGRALPATAVVRDGLTTMVIMIMRNMFRKFRSVLHEDRSPASSLVTCVSFRCRLQLQPYVPTRMRVNHVAIGAVGIPAAHTKTQLRFAPHTGAIDIRHTVARCPWLFRPASQPPHQKWIMYGFKWIGFIAFVMSLIVGFAALLSPIRVFIDESWLTAIAALVTTSTALFIGVCVCAMQTQLLRAVLTSFEFTFFAAQITILDLALIDLNHWEPAIVLAVLSEWLWAMWLLTFDAITPIARQSLGLTAKFAALVATLLVLAMGLATGVIFFVLPPRTVHDRVVFQLNALGYSLQFRALTWYCSCASTIFAGTSRFAWRLWRASETDLVVLDGPVVYEIAKLVRRPRRSTRASIQPLVAGPKVGSDSPVL